MRTNGIALGACTLVLVGLLGTSARADMPMATSDAGAAPPPSSSSMPALPPPSAPPTPAPPVPVASAPPATPSPAAPPAPVAKETKESSEEEDEDDPRHRDSVSVTPWPSLLVEPGAGAIVAPAARGGATFGFSVGIVRLATRSSSTKIASILAVHAGYTFAPLVDRGELTLTAGLGVSGPWALSVRGGPTIDTNGVPGFRAGLRGTLYHGAGLEVFTHHGFSPRNDTSIYMVLTVDLVPATLAVIFIGAFGGLFK